MKRTIVVCGHGPGISHAVARRFGREGYSVAIVARNADRLVTAKESLAAAGVDVRSFPCDLGDQDAVRALIRDVRTAFGPISVIHWNAYGGGAGDLTSAPTTELQRVLDISLFGMLAATQEALGDLKEQKGSLLVTGGGLAFYDPQINAMAVNWGAMGLAIGKAAQHKAVGLLSQKLSAEGVYVGEVVVLGLVKGTAFDSGQATLEPSEIADKFWELDQGRAIPTVTFG